jgi:glutathione S-transferase
MGDPVLVQIPFSHNCVKVRVVLALKGLPYKTHDIAPANRAEVIALSGQGLVPVLLSDGSVIADSTAIVMFLESRHPHPALIPGDARARAECLVLEDWADQAFMALSRRISYANVLRRPGALGSLFYPRDSMPARWVKERIAKRVVAKRFGISPARHAKDVAEARRLARIAIARLGGRPWLMGERPTTADVALATMSAPLAGDRECRSDPDLGALLAWGEALVPADVSAIYRG